MSEQNQSPPVPENLKSFTIIWIGQIISLLGSGLTGFALGIWVLQRTDSVTQYSIIAVIAGLPALFMAPFAGALVDRWSRKAVLICADIGSALLTLAVAILLYNDALQVWHIYIIVVFGAVFGSFQWPAFMSTLTMIVPRSQFGRVNGMLQFGRAGTTIAAPGLAGFLMFTFDIWAVLILDVVSFFFAIIALALVKIPRPPVSQLAQQAKGSLLKEAKYGWTFIKERPGLLGLLLYFAGVNFVHSMCGIALIPMVLRLGGEASAGTVAAFVGVGMLVGSMYMTATGGPKKRVNGVLGLGLFAGVCILLAGLTPSLILIIIAVVLWNASLPVANGCSQVIWQTKTPPDVQGRVFAMRRMIAQFTVPLGDFSAGPLIDYVFDPLLADGGALSGRFGEMFGTGPGRGIGLMMVTFALFPILTSLFAYTKAKIRTVEEDLPDALPPEFDDEPASSSDEGDESNEGDEAGDDAESAADGSAAAPDSADSDSAAPDSEDSPDDTSDKKHET